MDDWDSNKYKTQYSVSGSMKFDFATEGEAKEFLGDFVKHIPKKLTRYDVKEYIKDHNVPKGCCVCITKENNIAVDIGDADPDEFTNWADRLSHLNRGHYLDCGIKEVCSGNYVKTGKGE